MSKIGQLPILIPSGVTVEIAGKTVSVNGPKGKLSITLNDLVGLKQEENNLLVSVKKETKFEIKDEKIILDIENNFLPITKILNSKFKQIINLEFEVKNN